VQKGKDAEQLSRANEATTQIFVAISTQIRAKEASLRELGREELADRVRRLQLLEKSHLEQVARLQLWHTRYLVEQENENDSEYTTASRECRSTLVECTTSISEVMEQFDDLCSSGIDE
jgi:hypothetical protein